MSIDTLAWLGIVIVLIYALGLRTPSQGGPHGS